MMRKLSVLMLIIGMAWASVPTALQGPYAPPPEYEPRLLQGYDVSVDSAWVEPTPVMVDVAHDVVAQLTNHGSSTVNNIPIHGRILRLVGSNQVLDEGFEGTTFPPTDWTQVQTTTGTNFGIPCYWSRYNYSTDFHKDSWGAYVWWGYFVQDEWLITPEIDFTGLGPEDGGLLTFRSAFYPITGEQYDYVCVSTDGGSTWEDTLIDLAHYPGLPTGSWVYQHMAPNPLEYDLSSYAGQSIWIGWNYYFENPPWFVSRGVWSFDSVKVFEHDFEVVWADDGTVPSIAAGATIEYTFDDQWTPTEVGVYVLRVWIDWEDADMDNNFWSGDVVVGAGIDVGMADIERPEFYEEPYTTFRPHCIVESRGVAACTVRMECKIDSAGHEIYLESMDNYPMEPGYNHVSEFPEFTVGAPLTEYDCRFVVEHELDPDERDNNADRRFKSGWPRMVNPVQSIEPEEGNAYGVVTPQAVFRNEGNSVEENWWAKVRVEDAAFHAELWRDSIHVTDPEFLPLAETTITFNTFDAEDDVSYMLTYWTEADVDDYGSAELAIGFLGTGVDEETPLDYSLSVTPVGREFTIDYAVAKAGRLTLSVYDVSGQLVEEIIDSQVAPGAATLDWRPTELPVGLYFLHMDISDFTAIRKLILVK